MFAGFPYQSPLLGATEFNKFCENGEKSLTIFRYYFVLFSLTREGLRIQLIPRKVPKIVPFPHFPIFPYVFNT